MGGWWFSSVSIHTCIYIHAYTYMHIYIYISIYVYIFGGEGGGDASKQRGATLSNPKPSSP